MQTGSTRSRETSEAPGSSRREEQRARLIKQNEEYRRNQYSGARRRDFGNSRRAKGGKRAAEGASTELPEGEAGPTAPRASHSIDREPACAMAIGAVARRSNTDRWPRPQLEKDGHGVSCMQRSLRQNGGSALTRPSCSARATSRSALAISSSVSICRRSPCRRRS